jgi:CRISPR-associated protein Csy1
VRAEPVSARRIRIGFVSAFLHFGTVGQYFRRWITELDHGRFEVFAYRLRALDDPVAAAIRARADTHRVFDGADARPSQVGPVIRGDRLDVLVYPELGMDATSFALAALRLAPRQYVAWGHPVTTGHATIDGFLTCGAMEPSGADAHYAERLVRLPGVGTCYPRPEVPGAVRREAFSLPADATLLLCPQSLFKIHPDNDDLLARVLAADRRTVLVLFAERHPALTDAFMRRLTVAFERHGLSIRERTRVLPRVSHDDYLRINLACDLMLDTLHWSGGNTTLDAIACGLPVVTLPGPYMRGRQSAAMLRLIGLPEMVASDVGAYVRIASDLAGDEPRRAAIRQAMREGSDAIFEDRAPLAVLHGFLEEAAAGQR